MPMCYMGAEASSTGTPTAKSVQFKTPIGNADNSVPEVAGEVYCHPRLVMQLHVLTAA